MADNHELDKKFAVMEAVFKEKLIVLDSNVTSMRMDVAKVVSHMESYESMKGVVAAMKTEVDTFKNVKADVNGLKEWQKEFKDDSRWLRRTMYGSLIGNGIALLLAFIGLSQ